MKVLVIHNLYGDGAPSGENVVFHEEVALLRENGHEVDVFVTDNSDLMDASFTKKMTVSLSWIFNIAAYLKLKKKIQLFRPDVVHVHNLFPKLSPALLYSVMKTPLVMTLHNYRLVCPSSQLRRGNKVCLECLKSKAFLPAIKYGCYRDSVLATIPLVLSANFHRFIGSWEKKVDKYIALTNFQRDIIVSGGISEKKIVVRPNYFPENPQICDFDRKKDEVTFIGRVSQEKGLNVLLEAWEWWGDDAPRLNVVGSGPELAFLQSKAKKNKNIVWYGHMTKTECYEILRQSKLLVVPSLWFEGFPMVIREAFAHGVPILASNLGSLKEILSSGGGLTFSVGSSKDLLSKVRMLWANQELLGSLSEEAHLQYRTKYTKEVNYRRLIEIYESAQA